MTQREHGLIAVTVLVPARAAADIRIVAEALRKNPGLVAGPMRGREEREIVLFVARDERRPQPRARLMPLQDLEPRIAEIARLLYGEPNPDLSTKKQLRYGSNGSLAIEIVGAKRWSWFDHEQKIGGGSLELLTLRERMPLERAQAWLEGAPFSAARGGESARSWRSTTTLQRPAN